MSKRRRGFPSESRVKRGDRVVHGNKELIRKAKSLVAKIHVRVDRAAAFKKCCLTSGKFDGSLRHYYRRDL
jgi:hypothetical protein